MCRRDNHFYILHLHQLDTLVPMCSIEKVEHRRTVAAILLLGDKCHMNTLKVQTSTQSATGEQMTLLNPPLHRLAGL